MPLQNRVDPMGRIVFDASRGTLMGNRGVLHNASKEVIRSHRNLPWITCQLEFKGRKRQLMTPNMYTELFFLDEATAFAAGHRPCAECRRARYNEFRDAWARVIGGSDRPKARDMDTVLHAERMTDEGAKFLWSAEVGDLPVGAMFEHDSQIYVVHGSGYRPWSFQGYGQPHPLAASTVLDVLTPQSVVRLFESGFVPHFHPSIGA